METTNTDWLVDPEGTQEAVENIAARKAAGTWPTTEAQINAAIFAPTAVYEAIRANAPAYVDPDGNPHYV